jgi:mannose-6-phosphate isomerase-like protein (cupin superfamily)
MNPITRQTSPFRWEDVPVRAYKDTEGTFRGITRQLLHEGGDDLGTQLRYFEIEPGGHSTLERHHHVHCVFVARGRGACLIGDTVHEVGLHDVCYVPPDTWHQFRATHDEPLGFLCLVRCDRDAPTHPTARDLATLRTNATVAAFIRT